MAGGDYGAINASSLTIGGVATVTGNEAVGDVGAIQTSGAVKVVGNATISGNNAGGDYGAVKASAFVAGAADAPVVVTIADNTSGGNYGAVSVSGSGESFKVYGDANVTGNIAGTVAEVTTNVEESTGANGEKIVTTTTTTIVSGGVGGLNVENGSAKITGSADFSNNTAATKGAAYVSGDLLVDGALKMNNNVANGAKTVETKVTTTT